VTPAADAVRARSGDRRFLQRLRSRPFTARVHSVFDHAVNLRAGDDRALYALVSAQRDNAPATLVVDVPHFGALGLRPGAPVSVHAGEVLSVGRLEIVLGGARPWEASLPVLDDAGLPLEWMERFVARHGVVGGVEPRAGDTTALARATARTLADARAGLEAALRARDAAGVHAHARRLIGLGAGLTPAGDDYVVGVAIACAIRGGRARPDPCLDALRRAVDDGADRTTDLSRATLVHAVRGRVRESLIGFVEAIAAGDEDLMARQAHRVLAIGATSGTDILSGMLAGLRGLSRPAEGQPTPARSSSRAISS
jgi:Protein of unknown function (DUF2877)